MCNKSYIMLGGYAHTERAQVYSFIYSGIKSTYRCFKHHESAKIHFPAKTILASEKHRYSNVYCPKTIATVHEFHLHYSDFYDCGI